MSFSDGARDGGSDGATTRAVQDDRRGVRPAWVIVMAITAVMLLAAGILGGAVAAAAVRVPPPHAVLDARLSVESIVAGSLQGDAVELWTDPTRALARLSLGRERTTLYYVRDAAGTWYSVGRASAHAPWQRTRLPALGAPSLLTLDGVRALFAHMRARAPHLTWAGLHNHVAVAFPTTVLSWPFYYAGRATIWLDDVTGLPLQFRTVVASGAAHGTTLTVVDRLRTVQSSALPPGFLTPPDQQASPWDSLVSRVAAWLTQK